MGGRSETETPFTLLQDTVPSKWFWSYYVEIEKLHNVALNCSYRVDFYLRLVAK